MKLKTVAEQMLFIGTRLRCCQPREWSAKMVDMDPDARLDPGTKLLILKHNRALCEDMSPRPIMDHMISDLVLDFDDYEVRGFSLGFFSFFFLSFFFFFFFVSCSLRTSFGNLSFL